MSTAKDNISSDEAKAALDTIDSMNQIGLQRSEDPRWFAISIALAILLFFATLPYLFPLALIFIVLYGFKSKKLGVKPSYSRPGIWTSVVWVFVLAIFYVCVAYLREIHGLIWAPYVGGLFASSVYYIRYEMRRRTISQQRVKEELL